MSVHQNSTSLSAGLLASLLIHAGGAVALATYGDLLVGSRGDGEVGVLLPLTAEEKRPDQAKPDSEPKETEELKLGIADGVTQTETWLGYKDSTPHVATPASIDQAALTIATGPVDDGLVGGVDVGTDQPSLSASAPVPPAPAPQPVASAPVTDAPEAPPAEDARVVQGKPVDVPPIPDAKAVDHPPEPVSDLPIAEKPVPDRPEPQSPVPSDLTTPPAQQTPQPAPGQETKDPSEDSDAPVKDEPKEAVKKATEEAPAPLPTPPSQPAEQPRPPTPHQPSPASAVSPPQKSVGQRPGTSGRTGERTDQYAESTSTLRDAVNVTPGRPAAAKGLKIKTTPPHWSITSQFYGGVRNPVVAITFGKSGKVIKVQFVKGQSAGSPEVDGPLVDAIHEWRAEGEALTKLPDTADAGITVIMRITLRGI